MTSNERLSPDGVQATLNYTLPDSTGESLYTYHICPPPQMPRTNPKPDPRSVVISNVRDREDEFSLDTCGFEFFKYPRTVKEFFDEEVIRTRYHPEVKEFFDEVIRTRYYPEVKELLKTHTGGKRVIIIGHAIRFHSVHADRTFESSVAQVRETCGDRAQCLEGRIRLINVWRPIGSAVYHEPLALADWRSICVDDDILPHRVMFARSEHHIIAGRYKITPSETTLIKIFDSRADGCARLSLHSAFHDTGCPPDAPQRQSIEVNAIVLDEE
ncbi:hypothetical protein K503DRAFT_849381 [Rhizopogon vinicolor AM-OR11-026]|uniref:Methyltransferase n=1 Tax=Rhizopogon vinicolor AM-OR11-026 TaxID=1314800 RepID=A0A1B7N4A8_9AGAM|nr:hypothetical protein K503DRAFT_849381 [Rhizopogon vinicolor AM-OR11-026]